MILTESYGSDATFCVANPHTSYWQSKVSGVTGRLLEQERVDGVYRPSRSLPPMACWDGDSEVMDHPNGEAPLDSGASRHCDESMSRRIEVMVESGLP